MVSAEPFFGFNFIGDFFHAANEVVSKSVQVLQNVVSDVITGVSSTTTNIYHTIFGGKTPPATSGQNSTSPQNSSSENELKSNASKGSEASDSNKSTNEEPTEVKESANSTVSANKN